ncbi:MAG: glycosyltransferase family 61 protein [Cytophagaceae bacterium]|nr:glycosyltransferase family 61 protein [Cytophagaceae bacterium]
MLLSEESFAKRKLPLNLSDEDLPLFKNAFERKINSCSLITYNDVLISDQSLVIDGPRIAPESFVEPSQAPKFKSKFKYFKFLFRLRYLKKAIKIKEPVLWFTDNWSHEYFHWMTDALPRLLAAKDYIKDTVILLPNHYENIGYIQKSLKAFNVQKIIYIPPKCVAKIKKVLIPERTAPTGNYNEDLLRRLRDQFTSYYREKKPTQPQYDRIYISRYKALRRKISNEKEVVNIFEKYNFKVLYFEDYDFDEQAQIMLNAKYFISNHGAGLTNMLFMQPGTSVLELRRENDDHNNCYFAQASALNLKYYYQVCKSENGETDTYTANLIVDPFVLEKNIKTMLNIK